MRILTYTTLFPNSEQPRHGLFVENRLRRLLASGALEAEVVAPVPWFPLRSARFGRYATFARVPANESRDGLDVRHPRYPAIPRIGMSVAAHGLALATGGCVRAQIARNGPFDLIDAHYFYPDGVAAAMIARRAGLPLVISARGSDVNLLPEYPVPRRLIRKAARQAAAIIAVSAALADRLAQLGIDPERIHVLRNGVDLGRFRPEGRESARTTLGLQGPVLLAVGNLVPEKDHALALRVLAALDNVQLLVVGQGPLRGALEEQALALGIGSRVRFVGAVAHDKLAQYYNAADALLLTSTREGMPNVVLESLACGNPVVAVAVGGVPEVVDTAAAGAIVSSREPATLAAAVRALLDNPPTRAATRAHAQRFDWDATIKKQIELYQLVCAARHSLPA